MDINKLANRADWLYRRATASHRGVPSCLIIGAQKAGTSSLYHYLTQHRQIKSSFCKEVHYFDGGIKPHIDSYKKGLNWYRAHFPFQHQLCENDIVIDATPLYLFNPLVAKRIKSTLPKCKIIVLLRNPVERAISHYFHVKRHGYETLDIEDAFAAESNRLRTSIDNGDYNTEAFRLYSYMSRGLYLEQLIRYSELFTSDQLLVVNSEKLFGDTQAVLQNIFQFLGVDDCYKVRNLSGKNQANNKERVSKKTYQCLKEFFDEPNRKLFSFLNWDDPWQ